MYLLYKYLEVEKVGLWLLLSPSFLHCYSRARLEYNSAAFFGVNSVALVLLQKTNVFHGQISLRDAIPTGRVTVNCNIIKDMRRFLIKKLALKKFRIINHRSTFSPTEHSLGNLPLNCWCEGLLRLALPCTVMADSIFKKGLPHSSEHAPFLCNLKREKSQGKYTGMQHQPIVPFEVTVVGGMCCCRPF